MKLKDISLFLFIFLLGVLAGMLIQIYSMSNMTMTLKVLNMVTIVVDVVDIIVFFAFIVFTFLLKKMHR